MYCKLFILNIYFSYIYFCQEVICKNDAKMNESDNRFRIVFPLKFFLG